MKQLVKEKIKLYPDVKKRIVNAEVFENSDVFSIRIYAYPDNTIGNHA